MPLDPENEREKLRAETTELLWRVQADPSFPHHLFELLTAIVKRLDRLELGAFAEGEAPTKPERKTSSAATPAVKGPFLEAVEILDEAKKKKDSR